MKRNAEALTLAAYIPALRITTDVVRVEDFDRLRAENEALRISIRKALANLSPGTTAYEVLAAEH